MKKIYLAGPEVFLSNAGEIGRLKKNICEQHGYIGIFPLDEEVPCYDKNYKRGIAIGRSNLEMIKFADIVIANATPFRGPSLDPGTALEIGYAYAFGKSVLAYTNTDKLFTQRSIKYRKGISADDWDGMGIEEFEMIDNLMIDTVVYHSTGIFIINNIPKEELYTNLLGFRECVGRVKDIVRK